MLLALDFVVGVKCKSVDATQMKIRVSCCQFIVRSFC